MCPRIPLNNAIPMILRLSLPAGFSRIGTLPAPNSVSSATLPAGPFEVRFCVCPNEPQTPCPSEVRLSDRFCRDWIIQGMLDLAFKLIRYVDIEALAEYFALHQIVPQ
jgi:hypothetical protein